MTSLTALNTKTKTHVLNLIYTILSLSCYKRLELGLFVKIKNSSLKLFTIVIVKKAFSIAQRSIPTNKGAQIPILSSYLLFFSSTIDL